MELTNKTIQCPYCWERFSIAVDPSEGETQSYVYDCDVCCRPIDIRVSVDEGRILVRTKQGGQVE